MLKPHYIAAATRAYLEAALWADTPEDDEDLPQYQNPQVSDIDVDSVIAAAARVSDFLREVNGAGLTPYIAAHAEQVGHDLWLTQQGHGAGFWDRDYGEWGSESVGDLLNSLVEYNAHYLFWGDDDRVHIEGS